MINSTYTVAYRRRRQNKTDYLKRRALLASGKARLVVRRSSKHVWLQIVKYGAQGDKIVLSAHTRELAKFGWKANTSSIPAAYLIGRVLGSKAKQKKVDNLVSDIGLNVSVKGCVLYAAIKGVQDAGITVPCNASVQPDEKRINGEHIASYASALKSKAAERYAAQFSCMIKRGVAPETLPQHIQDVKKNIEALK